MGSILLFENPLVIEKGDELIVKCTYQSLSNKRTTFYGEGTSDEMCFSFLTYFPAENINYPYCLTWKSIPYCKLIHGEVFPEIDGCRLQDMFNQSNPATKLFFDMVVQNCRPFQTCLPECLELLKSYKSHPCLQGDVGDYIRMQSTKAHNMTLFIAAIDSCKIELEGKKECKCETNKCPTSESNNTFMRYTFVFDFVLATFFVFYILY
ncbi:hypothetical protein KUTeg_021988 [Tegillarca granosa]|uniref:Copper type II ascorbate-dependent monooxygenase C-terminal domain-containing protein n=1 Tax=Tegillarca granosa TaxID=220873 RepID=A0ABQ9E4X9_TEGGR|nr:hypothetical protein KUTeg_021988 [Tegillarca granosa]